ncbi:transcription termination factor Rho-like [Watersipora subatra]|uniref:transcription termination factor Rho-like n=1 Tax=Watersipora subatra TaxID=2589382 RepID=UPI00355B0445
MVVTGSYERSREVREVTGSTRGYGKYEKLQEYKGVGRLGELSSLHQPHSVFVAREILYRVEMESGFPKLVFGEHGDGSWERFIEEMNLCIESAVERRGYEGEGGDRRPIMRGRGRLVPLLRAIGHSGREEALRAREMANSSDRFLRGEGRSTDLKSEVKREVAKVSEFDSRVQYRSKDRDRSHDSADKSSPRGSPRSSREDRKEVGYDGRGSSRRSGGSRDNSYERYGSRDSSGERYRGRESPREIRGQFGRYRDNSMDRFEGEKYKERYQDSSKGRSVRFSGSRDKYEDDS